MDRTEFEKRLEDARRRIDALPPEQGAALEAMLAETRQRQRDIETNAAAASQALDDWRVQTKYMVFSLEAARRELEDIARRHLPNSDAEPGTHS